MKYLVCRQSRKSKDLKCTCAAIRKRGFSGTLTWYFLRSIFASIFWKAIYFPAGLHELFAFLCHKRLNWVVFTAGFIHTSLVAFFHSFFLWALSSCTGPPNPRPGVTEQSRKRQNYQFKRTLVHAPPRASHGVLRHWPYTGKKSGRSPVVSTNTTRLTRK